MLPTRIAGCILKKQARGYLGFAKHQYFAKYHGLIARARAVFFATTSSSNENEDQEDLEKNPYYERYADRIKKVQAVETQQQQQRQRQQLNSDESRLKRETQRWKKNIEMVEEKLSEKKKMENEENRRGSKLPSSLNDLIQMQLFETKTAEEITHIWMEHFREKECISAVIPSHVYDDMSANMTDYPTFLYPLPRSQGYEFVLSQFEQSRCFFTSLLNFQVHGENSPWQLCMKFYTELKDRKGVVLMTSELDTSSLNVMEAQCLGQLQKLFYVNPTEQRLALLHSFNRTPDSFKYMHLVKEVEDSNMIVKGLS